MANNSAANSEYSDESFQLRVDFSGSIYEVEPTSPVSVLEPSVKKFK